eukprot:5129139-Amphidinium_carterae.1
MLTSTRAWQGARGQSNRRFYQQRFKSAHARSSWRMPDVGLLACARSLTCAIFTLTPASLMHVLAQKGKYSMLGSFFGDDLAL